MKLINFLRAWWAARHQRTLYQQHHPRVSAQQQIVSIATYGDRRDAEKVSNSHV